MTCLLGQILNARVTYFFGTEGVQSEEESCSSDLVYNFVIFVSFI